MREKKDGESKNADSHSASHDSHPLKLYIQGFTQGQISDSPSK